MGKSCAGASWMNSLSHSFIFSPRQHTTAPSYTERARLGMTKCSSMPIIRPKPSQVVADANVVSEYVDMALFVVRAGLMKKDMLPIVDTFYNQKKFPSLSLILNGTSVTKTMGTKYGYGYGYGYGNYIKE